MKLRNTLFALIFLCIANITFAQAPPLGTSANFVLFSTNGGVSNVGVSQITGDVGTNSGASTGFGNINGSIHDNDLVSALAASDVMVAYNQLNNTVPTFFPAPLFGNGQVLTPGVYSIATAATLSLNLTLDAQGDSNAVFIFKIQGAFSTGINANVQLINGATPCNVFWKVEGLVNLGPGTTMRGTIISNNGPVILSGNNTLEGRVLAINGSIAINSSTAFLPTTCGCPMLYGPMAPAEGTTTCYALFSSNGTVTNTGTTFVTGDIGSNNGSASGYNQANVTGMIHPVPDGSTAAAAASLTTMYNYLNVLTPDIQLLFPAQFGNGLTLTPHTYLLNANTVLTDTLYLNALGNTNAVFVIKINGSLTTSLNSHVVLMNGAQAENIYWKIEDDITINANSVFNGTIVSQGNISLQSNVVLNGRALTRVGNVITNTVNVTIPSVASFPAPVITTQPVSQTVCVGDSVSFVVSATGTGLTYQWRRGNILIAGATNDTLTINPVTTGDAGNDYNVIVTGSCTESDTSVNVSLIINSGVIETQPVSQTICEGDSVSFVVGVSGTGITYQWQKGNVNIANAPGISGVNNDTLTFSSAPLGYAANDYSVIITGGCNGGDTSVYVSLIINPTLPNTIQPANGVVCVGNSVSFVADINGPGVSYQWIHNNIPVTGATDDTLTIAPATLADAGNYSVIITGGCPDNDTSALATLTVNTGSAIVTQPVNQTVCEGESAIFIVGTNGTGLTYQWMKDSVSLINSPAVSGANNDTLIINPALLGYAGNYSVIVNGGGCFGSDTSMIALLTVNPIVPNNIQPASEIVCTGDSVSFIASITNAGATYQWVHNNIPIPGAVNDTITIDPVLLTDAGNYSVIITGGCPDNDTSNTATLAVNLGSSIVTQPVSQTICAGDSVSFVVGTTGNGLTFQWQKDSVNILDGPGISGSQNDTLTFSATPLGYSGNYSVIVNGGGCFGSDTSITVSLNINTPATITTEPVGVTVCAGDSATLFVAAAGVGVTYQWYQDSVMIAGATNDTLTINPVTSTDGGMYSVIVSSGCGSADTSAFVSLVVNIPPVILLQPVSQTVCENDSVSFFVTAAGVGLTYQWLKDSVAIAGATNDTLIINPATIGDAGTYSVIVSGAGGVCTGSDTSANATLTIGNPAVITMQPVSQTVCVGDSVSFTAAASGTNTTYQWLQNGILIPGATNDTLTIYPATFINNGNYQVVVSGTCGANDTSSTASLNVTTDSVIISQPVSVSICTGDSTAFVIGTIGAGLTFQWYADSVAIAGATNDTLIITNGSISNSGTYYVIVSGGCGGNDTSDVVTLGINPSPVFFTQPSNLTVCEGDSASFNVTAVGNGLSYQWTVDGMNIPGETNDTITIYPVMLTDSGIYSVVVTDVCGTSVVSDSVSLTINTDTTITTQPVSQTICEGDSVSFIVGTNGAGLTYQWMNGNTAIAGATNDTLTINPAVAADSSSNYYVIVGGGCSGPDTSAIVSLTINTPATIVTQPVSQTICEGDSVSFTVTAMGTGVSYQWVHATTPIAGETNDTLTITSATTGDDGIYYVVVTGTCGEDTSAVVTLTIDSAAVIQTQPVSQTICEGDSVSFTVGATGSGLTYQWIHATTPIAGETNDTLTIASATAGDDGIYYVVVTSSCGSTDTSAVVTLTVDSAVVIQTHPVNQTVCEGDTVSFTVSASGSGLTYQWIHATTPIAGETNDTLTISSAAAGDDGIYYVVVSSSCGSTDTSAIVTLTVDSAAVIQTEPVSQTICEGDSVTFVVNATGSGLSYQWMKGNVAIAGATNDTLTINPATFVNAGNDYSVIVYGACGNDTSATFGLTINTISIITSQPVSQTVCDGDSVSFVVSASGNAATFQWMNGGTVIAGATNDTLTFNPATLADTSSNYYVVVSGPCSANDTSAIVSLNVNPAATITTQPVSQTVCEGDSTSFVVVASAGATFQWMNGGTVIAGATNDTLTFNPAEASDAGTNYTVIVSGGCSVNDTSVSVSLTINTAPVVTTQPASQTVCENDSVSFVAGATGTNVTYQWMNGNTTIAGATNSTFTINPVTPGDASTNYYVIVSGTCSPDDTSAVVSLTVNPAPVATASGETDICLNSSISLNAQAVAGASYSWTGPNGFTANTQNVFIAFAALNSAGTYTLTVTANGCTSAESSVTISVTDCDSLVGVTIPEGFSPNADMINDFFVISGILDFPSNTFDIYNRWGVKVYEAGPYTNTWDGTATKGVIIDDGVLPVGTYFYVLDLGNGADPIKGTIFLNR